MTKTKTKKLLSLALSFMMMASCTAVPIGAVAAEDTVTELFSENFDSFEAETDITTLENWGDATVAEKNNADKVVAKVSGDANKSNMMKLSINRTAPSGGKDSSVYRNVTDTTGGGVYSLSFDAEAISLKKGYGFAVMINKVANSGKDASGQIILRNNYNTSDGISFKNSSSGLLYKKQIAKNTWIHYEIVYNSYTKKIALYMDGAEVLPFDALTGNSTKVDSIGSVSFVIYRKNNVGDTVYFDNIVLTQQPAAAYDAENSLPESIVFEGKNLVLPTEGVSGSTISWTSSHPDVITKDGLVTPSAAGETKVTLTATVSDGVTEDVAVPFEVVIPKGDGGAILNPDQDGYVFIEEDFEGLNPGDVIAGKEGGVNGWSFHLSEKEDQVFDTSFTVRQDSDDAENNVGEAGRSSATDMSMQAALQYKFEEPVDSGIVEYQMRIKRGDERMSEWSIMFYDTAKKPKYVNFRITLDAGRVKAGDHVFYFWNEETNEQRTTTSTYPVGKWMNVRILLNLQENTFEFYQGEHCLAKDLTLTDPLNGQIDYVLMRTARSMDIEESTNLYFDDIKFFRTSKKLTDEERVALAKEELAKWAEENLFKVLENSVELPTKISSVDIKWTSDDEKIITPAGVINRKWQKEQSTFLHAELRCGDIKDYLSYEVAVAALTEVMAPTKELVEVAIAEFDFVPSSGESLYGIKSDLDLPTEYTEGTSAMFGGANIEWRSSPEGVISPDGKLTKTEKAQDVKLIAKFIAKNDDKISAEKSFGMTVLPKGTTYMYETFEAPESLNQPLAGWNNWVEVNSSKDTYIDDTEVTLKKDEPSQNMVMEFKRVTVNDLSAQISVDKLLEKKNGETTSVAAIEGGTANIRFRVKRNDLAKCLYIHLDDKKGVRESIRVNFNADGIRPGLSAVFPDMLKFNKVPKSNVWLLFEIEIDYDNNIFDLSIHDPVNNLTETFTDLPMGANGGNLAGIAFGSTRSGDNKDGTVFLIDDLFITQTKEKVTDDYAIEKVCQDIENSIDGATFSEDFTLSTKGEFQTILLWKSSNEDVIKIVGENAVVTPSDVDEKVQLTVDVIYEERIKRVVTVEVNVPAFSGTEAPTQEFVEKAVGGFSFDEVTDESIKMITKDLDLPLEYNKGYAKKIGGLNIAWSSSHPHVVTNEGKLTRQKYDTYVTLTATFSAKDNPSLKVQKSFKICVLVEGRLVFNETFQEADFEKDMYKTMDETGVLSPGNRTKTVYKNWILTADSDSKKVNTDTMLVYSPDNPYETVMNYTRELNNNTGDVPVTYTCMELDEEFTSGTLYINLRFRLIGTKSRMTLGALMRGAKTGNGAFNANYTRIAGVIRPVETGVWHDLGMVIYIQENPTEAHRYDVFLDGERVNEEQLVFKAGGPVYGIHISSVRTSDGPDSNWFVDDISIRHVNYDASDDVEYSAGNIAFDFSPFDSSKLELPVYGDEGTRISWHSSNPAVISDSGVINSGKEDENVTLTATITKGNCFAQRDFSVKVPSSLPAKPYKLLSFNEADGIITGATVQNNDFSGSCVLVTMLYSRGIVQEMRVSNLNAAEGGTETVLFNKPIDTTPYLSHEIRSYVYDTVNNKIISNVTYGGGR